MNVQPVFSYWTACDVTVHGELIDEWRTGFPAFRIFGDDVVRPIISHHFPERIDVYDKVRIPTAKADIALLVLLYEFGGLYIDCHCGLQDAEGVRKLLTATLEYDAIFFDRRLKQKPARNPDEHMIINSMIFARPKLNLILRMAEQALENFSVQYEKEQREGFVGYDIWSLSGPGLVSAMLLEPGSFNRTVRWEHRERVKILREEDAPIVRGRHRKYSALGRHWSERQQVELLFDHAAQHPCDLPKERLERALAISEQPALLQQLVNISRRAFGVFTRRDANTIIYPWIASRLHALGEGSHVLDFGTGVSPLPLYLVERGLFVDCVDGSDMIRTLPAGEDWNDWGFFDYGALHQNLAAHNCSILDFKPSRAYDAICSGSAIAHFPSPVREQTLRNCSSWLASGGCLVLTLDLIPDTDTLWNGGSEETPEQHGTYHNVEGQLRSLGFTITEVRILRKVDRARTDLYFLLAKKIGS